MTDGAHRSLLTFRLDPELRQRLKARLSGDGTTMSAVVTTGLRQYVAQKAAGTPGVPALPEHTAARLRELRASGRSGALSATLAALHEAGWPLATLGAALGVSKQAIQVRVRQRVPTELRDRGADCPPPSFPRPRAGHRGGRRPHVTIKIDRGLRAAAHHMAAHDGHSLTEVIEHILDRYLHRDTP